MPAERLSDQELHAELARYRGRTADRGTNGASERGGSTSDPRTIKQYYANLELPADASLADVRAAYQRLLARYAPERHRADPQKHALALQLAERLTTAYRALVAHLSGQ